MTRVAKGGEEIPLPFLLRISRARFLPDGQNEGKKEQRGCPSEGSGRTTSATERSGPRAFHNDVKRGDDSTPMGTGFDGRPSI